MGFLEASFTPSRLHCFFTHRFTCDHLSVFFDFLRHSRYCVKHSNDMTGTPSSCPHGGYSLVEDPDVNPRMYNSPFILPPRRPRSAVKSCKQTRPWDTFGRTLVLEDITPDNLEILTSCSLPDHSRTFSRGCSYKSFLVECSCAQR